MRFSKRANAYAVAVTLMLGATFDAFAAPNAIPATPGPITLSPANLRFGGVFVNTTSAPQTVLLTNNQSISLNISSIATPSRYFVENNNCPNVLTAHASCTISVTFIPNAQRNFNTKLTVSDDANTSPQNASMNGNGVLPLTIFKHIVFVVQENRTPDNLFQGLCSPPYGSAQSCSTSPSASQYDIQTSNWLDKTSPTGVTQPGEVPLGNSYDLPHDHMAFGAMCDANSNGICQMDGAANILCHHTCIPKPQFQFVDNSTGILNPYLEFATQYGWANYMFQTNQGPSFPAHQYVFGATSAPSAADDAAGIFADNGNFVSRKYGCISPAKERNNLIEPNGVIGLIYPCFKRLTLTDLLPSNLTWRYYVSGIGLWAAPNAIRHICQSTGPGGICAGQLWTNNLDSNSADVLKDIANCNLRSLSWVIPIGQNSDHAGKPQNIGGPSWVASIVNAIGTSTSCDGGTGYWNNTAILITWDDWGGWYDHEPPTILSSVQGDYEQGFRVPLIVVSAYTPMGYISNNRLDFGSILRFIEGNFGIARGALNFADARASQGLDGFFDMTMTPRSYTPIQAPLSAQFFLNDKRPPTAPDDD